MFFILIRFFKVDFTAWSNSTAVENHVVVKTVCGLVVNHIWFGYIRLIKVILTLIGGFKVVFTAWSNVTAVENRLVGKYMLGSMEKYIRSGHI